VQKSTFTIEILLEDPTSYDMKKVSLLP